MRWTCWRTVAWAAFVASLWCAMPVRAVTSLTFDVSNASIIGTDLLIDVIARYDDGGDAAAQLAEFQIDVSGSSANLTAAGADFSRFTFMLSPNSPFDQWTEINNFAAPTMDVSQAEYDNDFGFAPALPDTGGMFVQLGTITVDLAGLPGGQASVVSIANLDPMFGTWGAYDDGQVFADVDQVDVRSPNAGGNGGIFTFTTPGGPTGDAEIPEPATAVGFLGGVVCLVRRRRGDA